MRSRNFKPLVSKINQLNIDFDENEFDDGLNEAVKIFKKKFAGSESDDTKIIGIKRSLPEDENSIFEASKL